MGDPENRRRGVYHQRYDKTLFIAADGILKHSDRDEVIDAAKGAAYRAWRIW